MIENKIIQFKAQMKHIGSSKFILIPAKVLQFEDIKEEDVLNVVIEVVR